MELEWLGSKLPVSIEAKRARIDNQHPDVSIRRQCASQLRNRSLEPADPPDFGPFVVQHIGVTLEIALAS
jgi:hypothetical protein